jgi:hypothetical protein
MKMSETSTGVSNLMFILGLAAAAVIGGVAGRKSALNDVAEVDPTFASDNGISLMSLSGPATADDSTASA